ncbi:MAG: ATP-binding protein [Deltaproteobacteria bacterium]|nr:ATP-binding protein [Deltaproteobacteria bacterium]
MTQTGFWKVTKAISRLGEVVDERTESLSDELKNKLGAQLSEEKRRFEAFLRGIGDAVTIVDQDYRIIYVNDTVKRVFGDPTGEYCYKFYEHKTEVCGGCPVKKSFETGNVETSLRRVYTKEDKLLYMENTGSPIRDERGRIIAGIELARDVTQRIRLERSVEIRSRELAMANEELRITNEQLQRAYEELKAAQSALFQSEKMASLRRSRRRHRARDQQPDQLRLRLHAAVGRKHQRAARPDRHARKVPLPEEHRKTIELMKTELDLDYVREDVRKIVKNVTTGAQRIKEIVANLRTFSRVDSSENADVDVHEGLDSTLEILRHEYKNRIEIVKEYGEVPRLIGSPGKLNQVFMNILHNAIQAIEDRGTITLRTRVEDGNKAVIEIQDTGSGIPDEVLSKIFDPFFTTKKVGEGTGLGLSLSYSIIQDHKGKLSAESQPGKGTTFHIELPIHGAAGGVQQKAS